MTPPKLALEITPAFAVPFVLYQHPDPATLNAALRQLFLDCEGQGPAYANPSATMQIGAQLFESRFDLFKWPQPPVRQLREFCWNTLYATIERLNGYDAPTLRAMKGFADAWFHVTRRGGYFGLHNHPMAAWSGVYCVDAGDEGPPQPGDSGVLSFTHPNAVATMFLDVSVYQLPQPYGFKPHNLRLRAGDLVLFPSWLMHQVLPYQGDGTRITVAFNAWFKYEQPAAP